MKVCIIGAGTAGLATARYVTKAGFYCDVFESKSEIGGTWTYTDDVGIDEQGYPIYSAMYQGLRTNIPKEVMSFPDFEIQEVKTSYVSREDVLDFMKKYADHFNLNKLFTLNRHVVEVRYINECANWQVTSEDKISKLQYCSAYDVVIICSGRYNVPNYFHLQGIDHFKGQQSHSCDFRKPDQYKDQRVLLIGAGPSALDMAYNISKVARKVVLSHHSRRTLALRDVEQKPDVSHVRQDGMIVFTDGSFEEFDRILYCTGFKYSFSFLHESCNVIVEDHHVYHLYKHMINVDKPTMAFIGIPFQVSAFRMFDIQARFYVKYLQGLFKLPTREEMLEDIEDDLKIRRELCFTNRKRHSMTSLQRKYFKDLATLADIEPVPEVIVKMWEDTVARLFDDFHNFRNYNYQVLNDENFEKYSA